jgi:uncharacterized protein (TIGR00297 family)
MNPTHLLIAAAVNAALAAVSWFAGAVNFSGVIGGFVVGFIILAFGGWGSFGILAAFFVFGSAATRLGYRRKAALGVAQEDKGRRGAKHAFANCATAALAALAYAFLESRYGPAAARIAQVVLAGAFATALSDTASSEIGQLYGRHPFLITTFKPVPVGTDGAVSVEGTLAGIAAGALIGVLGWAFGLYGPVAIAFVAVGAFIGSTFESILGAAGSAGRRLNNELLNFLNTVVGGLAAGVMALLVTA